jgi:hypothetical protein
MLAAAITVICCGLAVAAMYSDVLLGLVIGGLGMMMVYLVARPTTAIHRVLVQFRCAACRHTWWHFFEARPSYCQRACSMAFAASAMVRADPSDLKKSAGRVTPVAWFGQYPFGFFSRYCWWYASAK